jgi:hypothetical protein
MKSVFGVILTALSVFGLAHQNTVVTPPPAPVTFPKAILLSPVTPAVPIASAPRSSKPVVVASRPVAAGMVLGTSTTDGVVTQSQLQAAIQQASNALRQLIYANAGTVGQGQYSTGGYTNNIALSQRIDQLNGTALTNVVVNGVQGLAASDIPDLGAIVHDNQGHDLSYRTFINGVLFGNILIDTSQVATDTIDYVATDTWGNTATSTRTVVIEAAASSSPSVQ